MPGDSSSNPVGYVGRKRRFAGWTLLVFGVLAATVWVVSRWWVFSMIGQSGSGAAIGYGIVWRAGSARTFAEPGSTWSVRRLPNPQWSWWFNWTSTMGPGGSMIWYRGVYMYVVDPNGSVDVVQVVLWPVPVLLWVASVPLVRSGLAARRARVNACAACGYSLAGLEPGAPCPECGKGGT